VHIRLSVGLHDRDGALKIWRERFGLPADNRTHLAYFETAYEAAGGLPAAFEKAARELADPDSLEADIRPYRSRLAEILPDTFVPLLRYDENSSSSKLVEAIVHIHVGNANTTDYMLIRNHRWGSLLLCESKGEARLSCDALARAALAMMRSQNRPHGSSPKRFMSRDSTLPAVRY
jgi:hypothetical protein